MAISVFVSLVLFSVIVGLAIQFAPTLLSAKKQKKKKSPVLRDLYFVILVILVVLSLWLTAETVTL